MPSFTQQQAMNSYRATLRAIIRIVEIVDTACTNPAIWSDLLSKGLQDQLGIAQLKLDVELQQRYEYLCRIDTLVALVTQWTSTTC